MTTVKICGLSDAATIEAAVEAGADMVGLVHFAPSPRHLAIEEAERLSAHIGDRAVTVALTVDAEDDLLLALAARVRPDVFQLHGRETPGRCAEVRALTGTPVMKALPVASRGDLRAVGDYARDVDYLLFDAKPPKGSNLPGGNGAAFDWSLLEGLDLSVPALVSGGLDAGNVGEALRRSGLDGVDVSSGVERERGVKDVALIRDFVARAKARKRSDLPGDEEEAA